MSCDIHIFTEVKRHLPDNTFRWVKVTNHFTPHCQEEKEGVLKVDSAFNYQSYALFAFLADVRNYYELDPVSPVKWVPKDMSIDTRIEYEMNKDWMHSDSYITLAELLDFDYNKKFVSKRMNTDNYNKKITYREHLGEFFFTQLNELKLLGDPDCVRIVFWFDN